MEDINKMNDTSNVVKLLQWYERDPHLLEMEKEAMHKVFPDFTLGKLDDGRLYWEGSLNIGVLGDNEWHIMAVYNNDHPRSLMSVRIYVIEPDMSEIIEKIDWCRSHLCKDSCGNWYLSTYFPTQTDIDKNHIKSAVSNIAIAVKWFLSFELVLTGDLSIEDFSTEGII